MLVNALRGVLVVENTRRIYHWRIKTVEAVWAKRLEKQRGSLEAICDTAQHRLTNLCRNSENAGIRFLRLTMAQIMRDEQGLRIMSWRLATQEALNVKPYDVN